MSAPRPPKTVTHAPARKPKAPVPVVAHRPPAPVMAGVAAAPPEAAWASAPAAAFGIAGPGGIQLKPVIGAPDDAYEREADRVAGEVVSGPASSSPPRITPVTPSSLRRPVQRATRGDPTERGDEERSRSSIPAALVQRATAGDRTEHDDPEPASAPAVQRKESDDEKGCSCGSCASCVQRMVQRAPAPLVQRKGTGEEKGCSCGSCGACVQRLVQRATVGDRTEHDDAPRAPAGPTAQAQHDEDGCACGGGCARCAVQRAAKDEERESASAAQTRRRFRPDGGPRMQDAAARAIASRGPGAPLVPGVRAMIEARLGVDLSHVRVHTDAEAQRATAALGARAFTHGSDIWLGRGESPADTKLVAHEATHVVQQGAAGPRIDAAAPAASVSPAAQTPTTTATTEAATATATTGAAAPVAASGTTTTAGGAAGRVQRWIPQWILDELNDYAEYIPGWTLFTVLIGFNPLTGRDVPRTAHNLVHGLLELIPFGAAIYDKLNEHGLIDAALAWVNDQLDRLDLSLARLERTVEAAWDDVSIVSGLSYNIGVLERHFRPLYNDVVAFAGSIADKVIDLIKEAAIGVAEGLLAENRAWALLKKILGRDPLRDVQVQATPAEILADLLMLIGKEEHLRQMRERGTLEETAGWLAEQVATFMGLLTELTGLFGRAWDAIQPSSIASLGENLRSLATEAGAFLQRVWDFATSVAAKVLEFVKKSLLSWLASFANDIPGFHLVTVIIGRNPFTDEAVPRTPANLIRGFITLLPNGNAIYARLQETGSVARVAARIQGAMEALGISWEFVKGIFTGIWNDLSIEDLIHPVDAFNRIVERYGEPVTRLFRFVNVVVREMVSLMLEMMNFPSDLIGSIISNAMAAIDDIKRDPIGFLLNMLAAVKRGFTSFFDHIVTHLAAGLADWMFRGLRQAGITPPADLSLRSVLDFVLQVLGISVQRIWQKLADRLGPERVARVRGAIDRLTGIWTFIRDVQQRGVAAIWEHIQSQISNLWDMVLQKAQDWIMERVINRAIQWIASLLDITGIMPVINSFVAFFRAIQSAIDYLRDILAIVNDYVATLASVARGDVEPGAMRIEGGLARSIPVAIGFLANQFGLGNIGEKIQEIVGGIRETVDRAIDWLIDRAMAAVQSLMASLGLGGGPGETDTRMEKDFTAENGAHHELTVDVSGAEPDIKVASDTPVGVQHQIADRRQLGEPDNESNPKRLSAQQKAALTRAWNQHGELVSQARQLKRATTDDRKRPIQTRMRTLMDQLTANMVAGDAWPATNDVPVSHLDLQPGRAVANPLTRRPGNTHGSAADPSVPADWGVHVPPQTAGEGGSLEWRRVHLIADRLHGPGNNPNNLVPGDESTNGDLRYGPEAEAYQRITRGETLEYTVTVTPHSRDPFFPAALNVTIVKLAPGGREVVPTRPIRVAEPPTPGEIRFTTAQRDVIDAYRDLRNAQGGRRPSQQAVADALEMNQSNVSRRRREIAGKLAKAPRPLIRELDQIADDLEL